LERPITSAGGQIAEAFERNVPETLSAGRHRDGRTTAGGGGATGPTGNKKTACGLQAVEFV
jgi:hypothetical protein